MPTTIIGNETLDQAKERRFAEEAAAINEARPWITLTHFVGVPLCTGGYNMVNVRHSEKEDINKATARARRIAACINLAAGVTTEKIEKHNFSGSLQLIDDAFAEADRNKARAEQVESALEDYRIKIDTMRDTLLAAGEFIRTIGSSEATLTTQAIEDMILAALLQADGRHDEVAA